MTILEAAIHMKNIDIRPQKGERPWKDNSAENLMKKINEIFPVDIYKLDILSSTVGDLKTRLNTFPDDHLRQKLSNCLDKDNCVELKEDLQNLGKSWHAQNIRN